MLTVSQVGTRAAPAGRSARGFHIATDSPMPDTGQDAGDNRQPIPDPAAVKAVERLAGSELGMAVAHEVMGWRSDHEQFADCWVDADNKLTGYYYGRPFSPYRDRNALTEVWKRIDALQLRSRYLECIGLLVPSANDNGHPADAWVLHTCEPEVACRAALLAVRMGK